MARKTHYYNELELMYKCSKEWENIDDQEAAEARAFFAKTAEVESHRAPRKSRAKSKENNSPKNQ